MNATRTEELRYLVHFADGQGAARGGSGMRRFERPLEEASLITDEGVEYVVTRVDAPSGPEGLGYAWARIP